MKEQERTEERITVADDEAGGDVVLTRIAPQVVVEKAPATSRITLEYIQHSDLTLLWISGNRLFLGSDREGREVIYRVVGWDEDSWSLSIIRESPDATPTEETK